MAAGEGCWRSNLQQNNFNKFCWLRKDKTFYNSGKQTGKSGTQSWEKVVPEETQCWRGKDWEATRQGEPQGAPPATPHRVNKIGNKIPHVNSVSNIHSSPKDPSIWLQKETHEIWGISSLVLFERAMEVSTETTLAGSEVSPLSIMPTILFFLA